MEPYQQQEALDLLGAITEVDPGEYETILTPYAIAPHD